MLEWSATVATHIIYALFVCYVVYYYCSQHTISMSFIAAYHQLHPPHKNLGGNPSHKVFSTSSVPCMTSSMTCVALRVPGVTGSRAVPGVAGPAHARRAMHRSRSVHRETSRCTYPHLHFLLSSASFYAILEENIFVLCRFGTDIEPSKALNA